MQLNTFVKIKIMTFTELQPLIIEIVNTENTSREEKLKQICALLESNVAHYNWVGFYFANQENRLKSNLEVKLEIIEELKSRDFSNFVAILSVSPYYNKPTQEGIYQHFKAIAEACPVPIIIYNVPGRTSKNMLPETTLRLARDFKNVIAVKEAGNNVAQYLQLLKDKPEDFLVISGDDMIALPMVLAGGSGVISVIAEGFPKQFTEMVHLGLNKKVDDAYKIHYLLADSIDMIFEQGNPAGIKQVFKSLGLSENTVRLPLVMSMKI